ncbi:Holliday junction branch migration protein RuvA [uncultured Corynebacterium sp.]|uniref:Holliday junction branch migration protein RuvA n=1 Tax=uncultured Corynebacterium sp. TaxID=159447 RepID=UPI0025FD6466|nr:Holliday junction branch migration protein RuvA [uncultured Corynebacterium sp.]
MIASLRGTVVDKGLDHVVIECGGVGYLCQATARTLADLPRGEEVSVLTTMVVREDSQTLYAFPDAASRELFALVQSVSGVGARMAMALLSVLTPAEIAAAVAEGDVKTLQRAPGVGKRLADRMAVDLKGKLDAYVAVVPTTGDDGASPAVASTVPGVDTAVTAQVVEALVGLGFPEAAAAETVSTLAVESSGDVVPDASVLLRGALSRLGGRR